LDSPTDLARLEAENARLRSLLADAGADLPIEWRLSRTEAKLFRGLLAHDVAPTALLMEVAQTTADGARVHMHRLRKKVAPHRLEIETITGKGWRLINRDQWRSFLAPRASAPAN
jgi:DNA-binding response OmpR family regulator